MTTCKRCSVSSVFVEKPGLGQTAFENHSWQLFSPDDEQSLQAQDDSEKMVSEFCTFCLNSLVLVVQIFKCGLTRALKEPQDSS